MNKWMAPILSKPIDIAGIKREGAFRIVIPISHDGYCVHEWVIKVFTKEIDFRPCPCQKYI